VTQSGRSCTPQPPHAVCDERLVTTTIATTTGTTNNTKMALMMMISVGPNGCTAVSEYTPKQAPWRNRRR